MEPRSDRGWGVVVALSLTVMLLSVVSPVLLIFVPLSLLLLALPPRRPTLLVLGIALAAVAFLGTGDSPLWYAERGWALLLGAWFVVVVARWPRAGFMPRALAALGAAMASATLFLSASQGGWGFLDWTLARRFRGIAADAAALWGAAAGPDGVGGPFADGLFHAAELQSRFHPALLALASLAGLAVAWWAFRRLAVGERAPLRPLREFRFPDDLVWLLIAGILLVILPLGEPALRAGSNVLIFMGALYALRGVAVVLALLGVTGLATVMLGVIALIFLPMVMVATALVGLTDTWFDLRARRAARPDS